MNSISALCPCCGAAILIPADREKVFCSQCGSQMLAEAAISFFNARGTGVAQAAARPAVQANAADFEIVAGVLKSYRGASPDVVIPNNVVEIGEKAFSELAIRSVDIPASVSTINHEAFSNCRSLQSVTLREGLQKIDWMAFENCSALTSIALPSTLVEIGVSAFRDCESLASIELASSSVDCCHLVTEKVFGDAFFWEERKRQNLCPHCGGTYKRKGLLAGSVCTNCGAEHF